MSFPVPFSFLANVDPLTRAESFAKSSKMFLDDVFVVFAVGAVIFAALVLWVKYTRKRRKRISGGEKVFRGGEVVSEPENEEGAAEIRRRYKRRVRRRSHRNRNPTLAETGGLPPARSPGPGEIS